jgi:two-component system, NtrC family, sensor histidine kinase HydH
MTNMQEKAPESVPRKSSIVAILSRLQQWMGFGVDRAFNATRWFAVLALAIITILSIGTASVLSKIMGDLMLHHDGVVALEFVQSLLKTQDIQPFFLGARDKKGVLTEFDPSRNVDSIEKFFQRVADMPNVVHTNVYDLERRVIWSSNRAAINRVMPDNEELDEALQGELVVESSADNLISPTKLEHFFLDKPNERFVENYIPVYDAQHHGILGVVEIYKSPKPIFATIDTLVRWLWLCALISGALLYAGLYWLMRRAERVMKHQQGQLIANEAMVAVGEMASAVAHGIRNPLASIRTSAELCVDDAVGAAKEPMQDIVTEVDRLEQWVRNLLTYAGQGQAKLESVDLNLQLRSAADGYARELSRLNIKTEFEFTKNIPLIQGDSGLTLQMLNSLIANAIEAMPNGGTLTLQSRLSANKRNVELRIADNGVGIAPAQLQKIFQPFSTSKRKGLGLGLSLVKRTMERIGGTIAIDSQQGRGTQATLKFPIEKS